MIKLMIFGAIIGVANIIPGVSGGTMAVVLNVYDKLISAIGNFTKDIKNNLKLLIPIGVGAVLGILLFAKLLSYCLEKQYMLTNFFFIGVILGSIPLIYRKATDISDNPNTSRFRINLSHVISFIITLLIMIFMLLNSNITEGGSIITSLSFTSFIYLTFAGALAAVCMIIPGISGSFVLVLIGAYNSILQAISDYNFLLLIPVGIGIVLGIFLGAMVIAKILNKYSSQAYFAILGFVVGSIPVIVDSIIVENQLKGGIYILFAAVTLAFGASLSFFSTKESRSK